MREMEAHHMGHAFYHASVGVIVSCLLLSGCNEVSVHVVVATKWP